MKSLEALLLTVLGGFAAVFWFLSRDYNPTAALFPRGIAIACLCFLAAGIWGRRTGEIRNSNFEIRISSGPQPQIFGLQAAYVLFIYLFGFFAATLAFLLIAPFQMRYTRWRVVLTHAVVLTLVLTGSFLWLFSVQLPTGIVWDLW